MSEYCPNCALLSNHFLTHNLLCLFIFRLSIAASSASFCLFVLTMTIAAPAVRAGSSMTHRRSNCVLLLCGNRVSTSSDCSDCVLSNFSCCLQMTPKSSVEVYYNRRGSVRLPNRRFPWRSAVPEPSTHRMRTVDNVITVVPPRNPCRKREYSQSHRADIRKYP